MRRNLLIPLFLGTAGPLLHASGIVLGEYAGPRVTLLAIDDYALPLRENLCCYFSKPAVRAEPVLRPSHDNPRATDFQSSNFYGTVLHDGAKFRMWYYGSSWKKDLKPDASNAEWRSNVHQGPVCYAESEDGIHWTKPNLGQVEYRGSRDNNGIALPSEQTEGAFVLKDERDSDPSRRYKMIYENSSARHPVVGTAVSADGISWTGTGTAARNLEPSSFYLFNGLYTIGAQNTLHFGEGGHATGRQGFAWISPDFKRWLPQAGESFLLPEPANPSERGSDRPYVQVHLGVGAVSYGNVLVGLYCQWHARPLPGDWFGEGSTYGNLGLLVSSDGLHFREAVKGYVFLNRHDSPPHVAPDIRYETVLAQAGNGILNVGDETRIYHGRWANTEHFRDHYAEIGLATLPRDRWGALGLAPHAKDGSVWTAPLLLDGAGGKITLNARGVRGMRVELANERFELIPEFSGENAGTAIGPDGLDCSVGWPKASLDSLKGRKFRLLIHLHKVEDADPELFAAYIACG